MRGYHDEQIPSYLDEFMWFERYGITPQQAQYNTRHCSAISSLTTNQLYISPAISHLSDSLYIYREREYADTPILIINKMQSPF